MTKWRETGYVPPSDGEESDEEISTQEDTQPEVREVVSQAAGTRLTESEKEEKQDEPEFMDIDQVVPRTQVAAGKKPEVLDMSHLQDEDEDVDMDRDEGGVTLPQPARGAEEPEKDTKQSETPRFGSPDPITGQPQPLSGLRPTLPRTPAAPAAPAPRAPSPAGSSTSSPLSPAPSPPTSPTTPRAAPQGPTGIAVVIPTNQPEAPVIQPTSPFYQRSLRQRKPIQLHPYLLEDARYKAHMKARGVQPVRIRFDEEERARARAAGEAQDTEFVVPLGDDDESQERVRRRHRSKSSEERPRSRRTSDPARLERPPLHHGSSNKRRKTTHGEQRRPDSRPRPSTPTRNAASNAQIPGSDIYELPDSPSPDRTPPAGPVQRLQNEREPVLPSSGTIKRVGLLSLLNDTDESDEDSPPLPPVRRPASTVMSTPRRASSLPAERSSPVLPTPRPPEHITVRDDDEAEEDATGSGDEGESDADSTVTAKPADPVRSKLISHFRKKGTRGVLPASFIKLNKPRAPEEPTPEAPRHPRRASISQSPERRPGVARTKVSAAAISRRISDLVSDQGESDSDSGNEPAFLSSVPAQKRRQKCTGRSLTQPSIVDVLGYDSDIPEDNTFDHGGPGGTRIGTSRRPKKSTSRAKRAGVGQGAQKQRSRTGAGTGAKRPRKSTGPKVGIVDAYRHARETKTPMPDFARIAARSASKRPNKGRQSPSRKKVFVLDTADNTREVQEVLRDWRRDALPFRASSPEAHRSDAHRNDASDYRGASVQARIPSPEHLAEPSARPRARKIPVVRRIANTSRPRQTSLHQHFPSDRSGNSARSKQRSGPKPLAVHRSSRPFITHRPNFAPVPAQLEKTVPSTRPPPFAQQTTSWRARLDDLADVIQARAQQRPARTSAPRSVQPAPTADAGVSGAPARAAPAHPGRSRRKGIARRVDVDIIERRQPSPEVLVVDDDFSAPPPPTQAAHSARTADPQQLKLKGLLPWGQKYSLNFDIHPLRHGTIFNSETLIGQGDLAKALETPPGRVGRCPDLATFTFGSTVLQWGAYEDNVASQFEAVMHQIGDTCERFNEDPQERQSDLEVQQFVHQTYRFFGFVVRYIADTLAFHDPLDAVAFGQRFLQAVEQCSERAVVGTGADGVPLEKRPETRLALQTTGFALLVVRQIKQLLASDPEAREQLEITRVMAKVGRQLLSRLVRCRFGPVRDCYEDQRRRIRFEQGIGTENYLVELWVLAIQTLDGERPGEVRFWDLLNEQLNARVIDTSLEIQTFEKLWKALFTLLPLFQFDTAGVAIGISDQSLLRDNWALVRMLVGRLLKIYNTNRDGQSVNINTYIRLLYARCHHLITRWSWSCPELIIPTLYEFFANSGLRMLKGEDHHGSPRFVDDLDKNPPLDPEDSDACFHLLLKVIAAGLKAMGARGVKQKTIDNLIYRLMPNHRRQYPKDEDLSYRDLAILRNHHDLLVTLYWAAPASSRPPIDAIQLLINPENTHIKAVTVVVRAWSNVLRFQLHSGEGTDPLKPLMRWFDYLVVKLLGQHQAARSDAEKQLAAARAGGELISDAHFEENVKQNQRRVEAVLVDLVHALAREMRSVPGEVEAARVMLTEDATATILRASTRLGQRVVAEVLGLIAQFVRTCTEKRRVEEVQTVGTLLQESNEESQDYGDASIFEDLDFDMVEGMGVVSEEKKAAEHLLQHASHAVFQLLSNCFGADRQPEDSLLTTVVDVWCLLAEFLVSSGLKSWDAYLRHGNESWSSLRDTPQTRKFTSYFMPKVIESDPAVYASNKSDFLLFWIKGLVERESMLAFQAQYTATLLNVDASNPVLANMPFVRDAAGKVQISQHEFRARRLALISTLLENMRVTYETAPASTALDLKREYAELLREMMTAMKANYQQLQATSHCGAYIAFVHAVISALHQHTTDLLPIDRFFTESSAFPLPANDPNYVVGRLRKFATKLDQPRIQHQLNSFFQSQLERSALTGAAGALVQQITAAVVPEPEDGACTLRGYFVHALLPVYAALPFENWTVGWVVAQPVLRAALAIAAPLEAAVDATHAGSLAAARSLLDSLLDAIRHAVSTAVDTPHTFTSAAHIAVLTLLLRIVAAATPALARLCDPAARAVHAATFVLRAAHYAAAALAPHIHRDVVRPLDMFGGAVAAPAEFAAARTAAHRAVTTAVHTQWGKTDGAYWFQRGARREVVQTPDIPELPAAATAFAAALRDAVRTAARTDVLGAVAAEIEGAVAAQESRGRPAHAGETLDGLADVFV